MRRVRADYNRALELATTLDLYNNGDLCVGPSVTIENPASNTVLTSGDTSPITIEASVLDKHPITQVEFLVDGVSLGVDADGSDGLTMDWDWSTAGEGAHIIEAIATNNLDETGSADVVVFVDLVQDVPMHVESLTSSTETGKGGKWTATVTMEIVSGVDPVDGATVTGIWDGGVVGSCITDSLGKCDISITNNKNVTSVTFTITDVTHATFVYDASNGISEVTMTKP